MMKKLLLLFLMLFTFGVSFSQEKQLSEEEKAKRERNIQAGNPFKEFGYKPKIATLSKGKYLEFHDLDSIVKIGSITYHVKKKSINGYFKSETKYSEATLRPEIVSRWLSPDPLSEEFPSWSPYNFVENNPIRFIDPDGLAPVDIVLLGANNSSVTIETDLIDVSIDASSFVGDLGGNYSFAGEDILVAGLDIVGIVDPTGVADGLAASIEAKNGNWGDAILSGMGVIPYIGDVGKVGKVRKHVKTIDKAINSTKAKNLKDAAEKGIPKSQLGPSGKPKIHTVSKSNLKQAKDAARNNPKSNSKPVKHSSDKGQKTHYHSTKNGKKLSGKDNVHYENRSSKRNPNQ